MVDIDRLDLAILRTVRDADKPMWKKNIYRRVRQNETLPATVSDVSVQTIGRRVDTLNDANLLNPQIIEPEALTRDLIIAYRPATEAAATIAEKREELLRESLSAFDRADAEDLDVNYLAELLADEIGLPADDREILADRSRAEVAALIAAYYLHADINEVFTGDRLRSLEENASGGLATLANQLLAMWEQGL